MENPEHKELLSLRHGENLDDVVSGSNSEMEILYSLLLWAKNAFPNSNPLPNYPPWNGRKILKMIRGNETGGFCAQYAILFGQACQSFGYIVRYLDLASMDFQSNHFVTEVYVPGLEKWVAFDPQSGWVYADKDGNLLSALQIHDIVFNKKRKVYHWPGMTLSKGDELLFAFFQYHLRNNFLSFPVYYQIEDLYIDKKKSFKGKKGRVVCQWNFEPYKLRYVNPLMPYDRKDFIKNMASTDQNNFDFAIPVESRQKTRVRSFESFKMALEVGESFKIREMVLPEKIWTRYMQSMIGELKGFEILDSAGESQERYELIQKSMRKELKSLSSS